MSQDPGNPDNPEGADIPDFIPEKFRGDTLESSAEALAASYSNLEREFTQTREHVKAMEENYALLAEQAAQPVQPQIDPDTASAQAWAAYENDPIAFNAMLAQTAARNEIAQWQEQQKEQQARQQEVTQQFVAKMAYDNMAGKYSDFADTYQDTVQTIQSNPLFKSVDPSDPAQLGAALETAYLVNRAQNPPAQPGYDPAAAKRAAQTATGGNPRPSSPDELAQAWEKIKNAGGGSYADSR